MIEFLQYPPVRQGSHSNPFVRDVESHLSLQSYNYFKGDTVTTTVHECTHGINADLRNKFFTGQKINCFYLMENRFISLPEPNWRKREVIPYIPQEFKGSSLYNLYVARDNWDDRPLYLWDEWVSYVNGSYLGETYSLNNALIFGFYAGAVIKKEQEEGSSLVWGLIDLFDWLCFQLESLLRPEYNQLYYKLRSFL